MRDSISMPTPSRLTVEAPIRYCEIDGKFVSRKTWFRPDDAGWVRWNDREDHWGVKAGIIVICIMVGIIGGFAYLSAVHQ